MDDLRAQHVLSRGSTWAKEDAYLTYIVPNQPCSAYPLSRSTLHTKEYI